MNEIKPELIFSKGIDRPCNAFLPEMDVDAEDIEKIIDKSFLRDGLDIPNVPEVEIVRHYVNLSYKIGRAHV